MPREPIVSQEIEPANKFLWAVKTYIDLISRTDRLVGGSGLKRLYTLSAGLDSLYTDDIESATLKAQKMGLIPSSLDAFLQLAVMRNLYLYGTELQKIINERVIGISNGDIRNPDGRLSVSPIEARRYYYVPQTTFVTRLRKALNQDYGSFAQAPTLTIADVDRDADHLLFQTQVSEGHLAPTSTNWGALMSCVEDLVDLLHREVMYPAGALDYKKRSRPAVKILWMIAKLLTGDLTMRPELADVNVVDVAQSLNFTDGTLAAIPFPIRRAIEIFEDDAALGLSLPGRFYLSAVSATAFYRTSETER